MRRFVIVALTLFIFLPFIAHSQDSSQPDRKGADIAAMASYWGIEDGGDAAGIGVVGRYPVYEKKLFLEGRVTWFDDLTSSDQPGSIGAVPIEFGVGYKFSPDSTLNPYVSGGGGYYYLDPDSGLDIDSPWGWYVNGGLQAILDSGFMIMAELNYRGVKEDFNVPVSGASTRSFDMSGVGANVGLGYSW